jgi:hypothetical protein
MNINDFPDEILASIFAAIINIASNEIKFEKIDEEIEDDIEENILVKMSETNEFLFKKDIDLILNLLRRPICNVRSTCKKWREIINFNRKFKTIIDKSPIKITKETKNTDYKFFYIIDKKIAYKAAGFTNKYLNKEYEDSYGFNALNNGIFRYIFFICNEENIEKNPFPSINIFHLIKVDAASETTSEAGSETIIRSTGDDDIENSYTLHKITIKLVLYPKHDKKILFITFWDGDEEVDDEFTITCTETNIDEFHKEFIKRGTNKMISELSKNI